MLAAWIKCSDGRLYHPVVAEKAIDAWKGKLSQGAKTEAARLAKEEKRRLSQGKNASVTETVSDIVTGPVTDTVTASKGQGERQGQGQGGPRSYAPGGTTGRGPHRTSPSSRRICFGNRGAGRPVLPCRRVPSWSTRTTRPLPAGCGMACPFVENPSGDQGAPVDHAKIAGLAGLFRKGLPGLPRGQGATRDFIASRQARQGTAG